MKNLTKVFKGQPALSGVSFSLERGEFLGILGPNGAGKTTLLNCLLGLVTPTRGQIRFFGLDLEEHLREILERINFASNYVGLPLSLTVEENLWVYALLYGVPSCRERIERLLRLLDLWEMRREKTRHLSSGQMMRLCLAKALINDPEVLLLDEPTAGLDPTMARKVRNLIKAYQQDRGMAVIFTSHNLLELQDLSDRVLLLHQGRILAEGPPTVLCQRFKAQNLEEVYFKALKEPPLC
ncbi:ABC transporter ATP-binding protein [Thermosulfurimonas marina]|uniref:ABC transporter ATP-binding protein n=1 Tax=Thermosulfurimonas marina TaxID=2047767 RepID=UPI001FE4200F|nr:ABC transporter ATP-binding protein [Thermosulfurimonas marina]